MSVRRGYVDVGGGQIHYRTAGPALIRSARANRPLPEGDGLPLVKFHMTPSSSLSWTPALEEFAKRGYRGHAFDTPGYGMSDPPAGERTVENWAELQNQAITGVGIDDFFLFGHHTGPTIAPMLAANHPERVRKLALWGYPAWPESTMAATRARPPKPFSESGQDLLDRWNAWKRISGDRFTTKAGIQYVLEVLQAGDEWDYGHVAVAHVDHQKLAARVTTPTLIHCGQSDMSWPECYECAGLSPNAESQIIDGGGVDLFEQFPAELAGRVDEFFRR